MPDTNAKRTIRLPRRWRGHVKSAVLHAISLAHFAIVSARGCMATAGKAAAAETERLQQEMALLREELRIKHARMARVAPQRRMENVDAA